MALRDGPTLLASATLSLFCTTSETHATAVQLVSASDCTTSMHAFQLLKGHGSEGSSKRGYIHVIEKLEGDCRPWNLTPRTLPEHEHVTCKHKFRTGEVTR